jgi:hypothetical protein
MEGPELDIRVHSDETPLRAIMVLARFTPAGGGSVMIVAGQSQGRVWLWDRQEAPRALVGHADSVNILVCLEPTSAPHERWVASAGKDTVARLWEAEGGRMVHAFRGHTGSIMALLAFKEPEAGAGPPGERWLRPDDPGVGRRERAGAAGDAGRLLCVAARGLSIHRGALLPGVLHARGPGPPVAPSRGATGAETGPCCRRVDGLAPAL